MQIRRLGSVLVAVGLAIAVLPATQSMAEAATAPSLTLHKIKSKSVPYQGRLTIAPSVTTKGNVRVRSKTLTVKKGKATLVKAKKTARIKAGTYQVKTLATYRTWARKSRTTYRTDTVLEVSAYTPVDVTCRISGTVETGIVDNGHTIYGAGMACVSRSYSGYQVAGGATYNRGDGTWLLTVEHSTSGPVTVLAGPNLANATVSLNMYFDHDISRKVRTPVTSTYIAYSKVKSKTLNQRLVVKQRKRPSRTGPIDEWNCPRWAPIKGNAQSMIYHVPSARYYNATKPEDCFSTQTAARQAGYRKAKV